MVDIDRKQLNTEATASPMMPQEQCQILNMNAEEILSYLVQSGTIDLNGVANDMKKTRREKILEDHPFAITESRDGRWRTYIKDENRPKGRRQIAKGSREKLEDYLVEYYEGLIDADGSEITMASLLDDWLQYKSLRVAETTIERVKCDWNRYYKDSSIVTKPLALLTKLDVDEWIHTVIQEQKLNKHQYTNLRSIINQELDYAVDRGLIDSNPFQDVKVDTRRVLQREHKKQDQTQVYSRNELEALCKLAWEDFHKRKHPVHQLTPLAVMFMFYTGLRIGEVCAIRYEDVDDRTLHVRRMVRHSTREIVEQTKGCYGDRSVPLIPQALELIETARCRQHEEGVSEDGYIFSMRDTPILYYSITKAFYHYCKELGIDPKSSHKARKTFVSSLLDADVNVNTVRQIVGHTDERTTLNNYCYDRSSEDEKYDRIERALA